MTLIPFLALAATLAVPSPAAPEMAAKNIYSFKVSDIDGNSVPLSKYKGKVLLVVNVASKCGNTPQYTPLESLYKKYKDQGFVVLGFPANDFNAQEPGTNAEIKEFCSATYAVDFPMFSKIDVKGPDTNPLYTWLISQSDRPKDPIEWNFAKFLVGRDGKVIKRIEPKVQPDTPDNVAAIEAALKA